MEIPSDKHTKDYLLLTSLSLFTSFFLNILQLGLSPPPTEDQSLGSSSSTASEAKQS